MFNLEVAPNNKNSLWRWDNEQGKIYFNYADNLRQNYEELFTSLFPNINLDPSTPQGQIITSLVQTDMATISYLENLANAFFMGGYGDFLDMWAWNLYRVKRKRAINSSVAIKINAKAGTQIPADFLVTDEKHFYRIEKPITIGESGEVNVDFYATELSDYVAPIGTITKMVSVVEGVERIENLTRAEPAVYEETDEALFNRCITFGSTANSAIFSSILANVAQVEGVKRIGGAENFWSVSKIINGVEMPSHSICVVVEGGGDVSIAKAMYNSRATGCNMVGDVNIPIIDGRFEYNYTFMRPTFVRLEIEVSITSIKNPPHDFAELITQNVMDYINNAPIGDYLTQPNLTNHLYEKLGHYYVLDVKLARKGQTLGYEPVNMLLNEAPLVEYNDITVYPPVRGMIKGTDDDNIRRPNYYTHRSVTKSI